MDSPKQLPKLHIPKTKSLQSKVVGKDSSPCTTLTSSVNVSPVPTIDKPTKTGHPRKELLPPSHDDFPASGTVEEQKHWMKKKNVQYWWYQKLTGPDGEEYHKQQSSRVTRVYNRKKLEEHFGSGDDVIINDEEADDLAEDKAEKIKEQNRVRFAKYS